MVCKGAANSCLISSAKFNVSIKALHYTSHQILMRTPFTNYVHQTQMLSILREHQA